jgi:hypothetical protein
MLSVIYAECPMQAFYAEYRYAECSYSECHYGECRGPLHRRSALKYELRGEPLWFSGIDRVK